MDTVKHNLVFQQLWTQVRNFSYEDFEFCVGTPPKKLRSDDDEICREYVAVSYTKDQWSVKMWADVFAAIKRADNLPSEPKRVVMAMITDDSTVVYYLVHNGLAKPRRN